MQSLPSVAKKFLKKIEVSLGPLGGCRRNPLLLGRTTQAILATKFASIAKQRSEVSEGMVW